MHEVLDPDDLGVLSGAGRHVAAGGSPCSPGWTATVLIEHTDLSFSAVAYAAGLRDVAQLNETVRHRCGLTPTALRRQGPPRTSDPGGTVSMRLAVRTPFAYQGLFGHLAACAVPGVEEVRDGAYRRTLRLRGGNVIVELAPAKDHVRCRLTMDDFGDLSTAIARCRHLLDLDADPDAVVDALGRDPQLRALVVLAPGQRIPRTVDEHELALRVVLGQQVSIKAARTHARRIALAYGRPISDAGGGLTHVFPATEDLADIDPVHLAFPKARQRCLTALIHAMANGSVVLDRGCDWKDARAQLLALPGIGPWTTEMIAMRGLGDPDAFPSADLGVRLAAGQLGLPPDSVQLAGRGERWRPWRSYATQYMWTTLDHAVNEWPPKSG